jgi:hypothetical protein
MHQVALLLALGATGGLFGNRHAQPSCSGGACATPAYTYRSAPASCASGNCAAPVPTVRTYATPTYTYRPAPVTVQQAPAATQPIYQTAQARSFTYSRYYAPSAGASCPTGNCPYTR